MSGSGISWAIFQVCTSLQTDNHASTPPLLFFYRPNSLPATQPTASKYWRQIAPVETFNKTYNTFASWVKDNVFIMLVIPTTMTTSKWSLLESTATLQRVLDNQFTQASHSQRWTESFSHTRFSDSYRDTWTILVPIGKNRNTDAGQLLLPNQWHHCHTQRSFWILFTSMKCVCFSRNASMIGGGFAPSPDLTLSFFKIKFLFKNLKFYSANQCVPRRRHKSKH